MARSPDAEDPPYLTVRIPRWLIALAVAVVVHVVAAFFASKLPNPKKPPERIQIAFTHAPPAAKAPAQPVARASPPPSRPKPKKSSKPKPPPPPTTSPVVPELPPDEPSDDRAELPVAEQAPEPAPPPRPSSDDAWKKRLFDELAETRPKPTPALTGDLAPSFGAMDRVAAADPRLHDEETEQRMVEDFGPFFQRGLEALRNNWHPDTVLDNAERDPTERCGRQTRVTFAVAVLDKQGNVVDVDLKNPSGCRALDAEAVAAFKRVAQFPHPPAGMFVGPDGAPLETARYPVRFIVTFDGGLRLDWRW